MASHHPYAPARWWRLVIRPEAGRAGLALRVAGISMAGVLIGEIWQLPLLSLIPIMAGALWQANRMANMRIGVMFLVFFTVVSAGLYVGAVLTVNNFFATLAVNLLFSFVFFFLGTASVLGMVSVIGGLILSYMLLTLDTLHDGDSVTRFILHVWLIFLIAGGLLGVVGSCLSPSPLRCLTGQVAARFALAGDCLAHWARGQAIPQALREAVEDMAGQGVSGMAANLALAGQEKRWGGEDLAWLRRALRHSFAILQLAECQIHTGALPDEKEAARLRNPVEVLGRHVAAGERPASMEDMPACTTPALAAMARLLHELSGPVAVEAPAAPAGGKGGFFVADAFSNPEHVRQAIKGTVSVALAIVTYKLLNWPGVHTCIITCFIVSMPTMGAVLDKQLMRILGALLGCGFSMLLIVWIVPHLTNIAQLLLMVGGVIFIGAWIKAGDERISYIGLQIMVAFLLCDLVQYAPATDLTVPRDRVIGILIGLTISFAVHTLFWPRSATGGLMRQLEAMDGLLAEDVRGWDEEARILHVARMQETARKAMQALRYAMLEPAPMRPTRHRQRQYRAFLRRAVEQAGQMLGAGGEHPPRTALRLVRITGEEDEQYEHSMTSGRGGAV